jgi:hypothetical protein
MHAPILLDRGQLIIVQVARPRLVAVLLSHQYPPEKAEYIRGSGKLLRLDELGGLEFDHALVAGLVTSAFGKLRYAFRLMQIEELGAKLGNAIETLVRGLRSGFSLRLCGRRDRLTGKLFELSIDALSVLRAGSFPSGFREFVCRSTNILKKCYEVIDTERSAMCDCY